GIHRLQERLVGLQDRPGEELHHPQAVATHAHRESESAPQAVLAYRIEAGAAARGSDVADPARSLRAPDLSGQILLRLQRQVFAEAGVCLERDVAGGPESNWTEHAHRAVPQPEATRVPGQGFADTPQDGGERILDRARLR